jgi:hypothetical protein
MPDLSLLNGRIPPASQAMPERMDPERLIVAGATITRSFA